MPKKLTLEKWLERATTVHGDKWGYELIDELPGSQYKVPIKCPKHGVFMQNASAHIHQKSGCPKCALENRVDPKSYDTEEFIRRSRKRHGTTYLYDETEYTGADNKVKIGCEKHGPFWQVAHTHLKGTGCPTCAKETGHKWSRDNFETFTAKAIKVQGDVYTYIGPYKNNRTALEIRCDDHGPFWQTPNNHLKGQRCPKCAQISLSDSQRFTAADQIQEFRSTHGDRYGYHKVTDEVVNGTHVKVPIICDDHGEFMQTPAAHKKGQGCPTCGDIESSKAGMNVPGKVGYSSYAESASRLPLDKTAEGEDGILLVECRECKTMFAPFHQSVRYRITAINNIGLGNYYFYCSDECKKNSPDYKATSCPSSLTSELKQIAEFVYRRGKMSKKALMREQIAEFGLTHCERCGAEDRALDLHHTIRVLDDPEKALDRNGHMLICEECHTHIHRDCGGPRLKDIQADLSKGTTGYLSDELLATRLKLLQDQVDGLSHMFCECCNASYQGKAHRNKELYLAKDPKGLLQAIKDREILLCKVCVVKLYKDYHKGRLLEELVM